MAKVSKHILVTGSQSQLAQCLADVAETFSEDFTFHFKDRTELDITDASSVLGIFSNQNFHYCINCAAYTAVDKAEDEPEITHLVNAEAVKNLAETCHKHNTTLIHISTDFVFDGTQDKPFKESDNLNPLSVYGTSKLKGEQYIKDSLSNYYIIRTSWLYSEYGTNFLKTMLRLSKTHKELNIVDDQTGTPTYAGDLAAVLCAIINNDAHSYGVYHYSNEGETNWFQFAKEIFRQTKISIIVKPISSKNYNSKALRPKYSVLDTTKIQQEFDLRIPLWSVSLANVIAKF